MIQIRFQNFNSIFRCQLGFALPISAVLIKLSGNDFDCQSRESDQHPCHPDDEDEEEGRHRDLLLRVVGEDEDAGLHGELQGQRLVVKVVEKAA